MHIPSQAEMAQIVSQKGLSVVTAVADRLGLECHLVGGSVRDILLGRPSVDLDIVVVGSGVTLAREVAREFGKAHLSVFKTYGTAQVKHHGVEYEFVGARRESYHADSRNPICEDGTLEDDQKRRDFTINALAVCLNSARLGELTDPFGGLQDLEDKLIVTPLDPDITFSDDPLRMMRCVRFATQLNFSIADETFEALRRNCERIRIITAERITTELRKIINSPIPSKGFADLQRCGLLPIILPELSALDVVETRNGRSHKNNFYHTLQVLDTLAAAEASEYLRWAALLHDIGKPRSKKWEQGIGWTFHNHDYLGKKMIKPLFRRMKLPLDERMKYVEKLVGLHMRPIAIADDSVTDSAVRRLLFDASDDIDDLMQLCEADITGRNEERNRRFHENFQTVRCKLTEIEEKDRLRNFQPPVSGEEIMEMCSLPPSREVGVLKSALKDAILEGIVPNEHDPARAFVEEKAREMGLLK